MIHNIFTFIIRMGQQTSLNCRSSQKQDQHEIETTQANAINIIKSRGGKSEEGQSDIKSKKSTTIKTDFDHYSSFQVSNATQSKNANILFPQHENILKVASSPFSNCQRIGNRFSERGSKLLSEIVETRYGSNMYFPQAQVVTLIESLVYSLRYLQKFDHKHHDYYPTNVHYCSGIFKITNPLTFSASAYVLTQERKRFSFLSPELISEILNETSQAEIPLQVMWKSDVFAIGMMALEFCTLLPSAECYDQENYSLFDKVIRERLVKVSRLYSPNIADCIAQMLRYQFEERIGVEQLALLVFLNSSQEKIQQPQDQRLSASKQPQQNQQARQSYQANPPHVQQQFLILPPGQVPPPHQQMLPINQNSIAIPTPNYTYTRIGPNNQGLLSPTTLQNKLKVIELIHEKPQEEQQSEQQTSHLPSNILPMISNQPSVQPRQSTKDQIHQINAQKLKVIGSSPNPQGSLPYFPSENYKKRLQISTSEISSNLEKQAPKYSSEKNMQIIDRSPPAYQPKQGITNHPNISSNKFLSRVDENGQTLQQRVQRILQMSRSIK